MKQCNILVNVCFAASKTGLDFWYKKLALLPCEFPKDLRLRKFVDIKSW